MQETEFRSLPSLAQQNNFPHQQQQHPSGNSQSQQQQLHQPLSVSTSVHGGQLLPSMKTAGVRGGPGSGGGPPGSNSSTPMMMMPPQQQQQQPPQQPRSAHVSGSTPTAAIVYHSPGPIASSSAKRHSMHSIPTSSSTSQSRLSEFLDVARAEAESLLESYSICRTQKDEFEARRT